MNNIDTIVLDTGWYDLEVHYLLPLVLMSMRDQTVANSMPLAGKVMMLNLWQSKEFWYKVNVLAERIEDWRKFKNPDT